MGDHKFDKVVLGCDHGGFDLKEEVKKYLEEKDFKIIDLNSEYENPINFVNSAREVCKKVLTEDNILGFLMCGTGLGISVVANRVRNIRATVLYDDFSAEYARRHNNANILVFGGRTMEVKDVKRRIAIFLDHEFEGGKYARRNKKLEEMGTTLEELKKLT